MRKLSATEDYTLFQMLCAFRIQSWAINAYIQHRTKYGKAYRKAMDLHDKLREIVEEYESALADCVEDRI